VPIINHKKGFAITTSLFLIMSSLFLAVLFSEAVFAQAGQSIQININWREVITSALLNPVTYAVGFVVVGIGFILFGKAFGILLLIIGILLFVASYQPIKDFIISVFSSH